ncbi:MAG TPA: hypothetical protein VF331_16805 [Polyangiales bacterium]
MSRFSRWSATACLLAACSASATTHHGQLNGGAGTTAGPGSDAGTLLGTAGNTVMRVGGGDGGPAGTPAGDGGGATTPIKIDQCGTTNPAGLDAAALKTLLAGSGSAAAQSVLYPYDGTIFPRGLIAPLVMWQGSDDAEVVYVHLQSSNFEYKGCLKPTAAGQLQLPQDVWTMAEARAQGAADPFTLELTTQKAGVAKGPVSEKVIIAQATLKGSIYYNSYASKLATNQGAVLRIVPGKQVELFEGGTTGCEACHAVSADGTRLVAQKGNMTVGSVYALTPTTMAGAAATRTDAAFANFVGLSPDGKVYLTSAKPGNVGLRSSGSSSPTSAMYETDTGTAVMNTGVPSGAIMPTFSPDAKHLAFNDYAIANGHGLALMDYDATKRVATKYKQLYMDANKLPGWPFVLPDDRAVVFALGTESDFSGANVGINAIPGFLSQFLGGLGSWVSGTKGPYSNLFVVSADGGGTPVILAKAMGYATPTDAASQKTYLPFGMEEVDQNYYPTVSPVAAGGYFWVFFDSMRHYGNKGIQRQLWGTAVTVAANGKYESDPSHPAFYLTGQEEGTGNHRAFTALDPCRPEGGSCTTGIDCCGGFCNVPKSTSSELKVDLKGSCNMPKVPTCSKTDEHCVTAKDCCTHGDSCIAGYCGQVIPQ